MLDFLASLGTHMAYQVGPACIVTAFWGCFVAVHSAHVGSVSIRPYAVHQCPAGSQHLLLLSTKEHKSSQVLYPACVAFKSPIHACTHCCVGVYLCYLQQELPAMLEYLGVSKRICLYLARKNAQQTIDHLVYEVSLQLLEDEGPAAGGSSGGTGSGGYSHQRAGVPLEFAAVLQQYTGELGSVPFGMASWVW